MDTGQIFKLLFLQLTQLHEKHFFSGNYNIYTIYTHSFYRTRVRSLGMLVTNSLTHSLTDCCLVNLIDVTLACEADNLKLVEVVTVADVDDENRVGSSLLQIWKLRFGQTLSTRFGQGLEVEVQARFEAGVWSVFCC